MCRKLNAFCTISPSKLPAAGELRILFNLAFVNSIVDSTCFFSFLAFSRACMPSSVRMATNTCKESIYVQLEAQHHFSLLHWESLNTILVRVGHFPLFCICQPYAPGSTSMNSEPDKLIKRMAA
mmetsp:Transcript_23188/g.33126  ORF Transcript_23188/g.33126 Transcript_23188/m.33126 type:complete len:124 (+) Transcript_23188:906-1277(+)